MGDICRNRSILNNKPSKTKYFLTDFDLSFNQNNIKYFTMTNNIIQKINRHVIDWYGTMGCTSLLHLIRLFLQYITALLLIVLIFEKISYYVYLVLAKWSWWSVNTIYGNVSWNTTMYHYFRSCLLHYFTFEYPTSHTIF